MRRKARKMQESEALKVPRASTSTDQAIAPKRVKKSGDDELDEDDEDRDLALEQASSQGAGMSREITRFQIREDVRLFEMATRGLEELYLRPEDPSMAVLTFLERVSSHLGAIKSAYAHSSGERNALPAMIHGHLREIRQATIDLEQTMDAIDGPEDTNRSLPSGG